VQCAMKCTLFTKGACFCMSYNTKFNTWEYCHFVCPKTNKCVCHFCLIQPSKLNKVFHK
jgi:hypothetical protein